MIDGGSHRDRVCVCLRSTSWSERGAVTNPIMPYHYVWLVWSSAFLLPWVLL